MQDVLQELAGEAAAALSAHGAWEHHGHGGAERRRRAPPGPPPATAALQGRRRLRREKRGGLRTRSRHHTRRLRSPQRGHFLGGGGGGPLEFEWPPPRGTMGAAERPFRGFRRARAPCWRGEALGVSPAERSGGEPPSGRVSGVFPLYPGARPEGGRGAAARGQRRR